MARWGLIALALGALKLLPPVQDLGRSGHLRVSEHVRVPVAELPGESFDHFKQPEPPFVGSDLGVEDDLAELPHISEAMLVTLGKAGIKTLDDLADLATDELIAKKRVDQRRRKSETSEDKGGILSAYGLNEEQGNEIIMAARAHWFEEEA